MELYLRPYSSFLEFMGGMTNKITERIRRLFMTMNKVVEENASVRRCIMLQSMAAHHISAQRIAASCISEQAGKLLEQYGTSILRLAYSYLHNMSEAEDVLQDTLIRYMESEPTFESEAHEKAWMLRVAANISKNRIQYNKIRETDELMEELVAEEETDLAFVWEAVKKIPEKYREVIHLYYQEGYSTKEIAEILNKKEATVRSDLKRGREQLKIILKEAYDFG